MSPIQFDLTDDETRNSDDDYHNDDHHHKRQKKDSLSSDRGHESDERDGKFARKIKKLESSRKFDDVPACKCLKNRKNTAFLLKLYFSSST